ncbi:sensor histidine kinase [Methylobacterium oryzihabitans]|uniref:C4-dicarboxylate transport sensor protein DctB n=1 Tax=Methylobacterium oryzihabitans TaxID=2499852 RepID=A0A437NYJ8_9HYPH|nr:sensor histidine kinase [Methylobacterium oryzihabitans]
MRTRPGAPPPGWPRLLPWIAGLVLIGLAALLAGRVAARFALADLVRSADATLALQGAALRAEMRAQAALPLALATDPQIAAAVGPDPDPALLGAVDRRLAEIASATGAATLYVIRGNGLTVAASNSGEPTSFVGNNYAFRPYFRQALETGGGSQFALGTTSRRAGLYLSRRVPAPGGAGVVVVKIEFETIEAAWQAAGESVFVTDPRGIVLVASDPAWRFAALDPISPEERQRIRHSLEFGAAPLSPLPFFPAEGDEGLIRVSAGPVPARLFLHRQAPVSPDGVGPGAGWRLHTLTPAGPALERERVQAQIIAALVTGLAGIGLAIVLDRRRRVSVRFAEAAARREELEARVDERTRELTGANRRLLAEIEERRRAEAERERLGHELAQAARLAALGQFAASMAHEINQPLAAIRSYADNTAILVQRGRLDDARENFSAIGRLTDRIAGLTRQLKGFARRASGRREPVDLAAVIRGSLEVVEARALAAGVVLAPSLPDPVPAVLGEGPRLEQVVVNLLQNAVDAVANHPAPRVRLSVTEAGERVALEVADNGPGIPEEERARVFDAFFTTKPEGLGLGLAISRGIVEESGGTLTVGVAPEGGALMRVELSRAPDLAAPFPDKFSQPPAGSRR